MALGLLLALVSARAAPGLDVEIGLNFTACTLQECGAIPPDTMGAVGEDHIVHFINNRFRVFQKSDGALLQSMSDYDFWIDAGVESNPFDPRVVYDPFSRRWFASESGFESFLVAVSRTSDPTRGWTGFEIDGSSTNEVWVDFPMLGFDSEGVYLTADMFTFSDDISGMTVLVLPKADLLAPSPSVSNATIFEDLPFGAGGLGFAPQPAVNLDGTGGLAPLLGSFFGGLLHLARVTGPITAPVLEGLGAPGLIPNLVDGIAPNARQPGPFADLETDADKFSQNLVLRNGRLWGAHAVLKQGRSAIEWIQFDPDTRTILQKGTVFDPDLDFLYPSIAVNAFEEVVIGFTGSGETQFPSTYAVVGQTHANLTTFGDPVLLAQGQGSWDLSSGGRNRWGDYSATVVDPTDPRVFWTFQERTESENNWATQITEIRLLVELLVDIDIKPGQERNPINPSSRGLIPVAILGSDQLDVSDVDLSTLAFGPEGAAPAHSRGGHVQNANDDAFPDLVSHYRTVETGIGFGDVEACVTGETLDGRPFAGCDSVRTVPQRCGIGVELGIVLPILVRLHRMTRRRASRTV